MKSRNVGECIWRREHNHHRDEKCEKNFGVDRRRNIFHSTLGGLQWLMIAFVHSVISFLSNFRVTMSFPNQCRVISRDTLPIGQGRFNYQKLFDNLQRNLKVLS